MYIPDKNERGFTLIELSIVLVIIGLIVGGVLVGQSLIAAAGVRATITQIEKYNTAANTFREKYGYLPGDIPDPAASSFGFKARGSCKGQGDGNGFLEGWASGETCGQDTNVLTAGETVMFWVDLSTAHLIDGNFKTASSTVPLSYSPTTSPNTDAFLPAAKIGRGNSIYVYGGTSYTPVTYIASATGTNFFSVSAISLENNGTTSTPALTVQEAYSIDSKVDDGLPQYGRVTAQYLSFGGQPQYGTFGAGTANPGGGGSGVPSSAAVTGGPTTCYDNGGATGTQHYSVEISSGSNVTCALSFQLQAGD